MNNYQKAMKVAVKAHEDQKDLLGESYIMHPMRIAMSLETEEQKIIGVLHDVVEDSDWTLEDIEIMFGKTVTERIGIMTHEKGVKYEEYILKISKDPICTIVKIADLRDNTSKTRVCQLPQTDENMKRLKKYFKALKFLTGKLEYEEYIK